MPLSLYYIDPIENQIADVNPDGTLGQSFGNLPTPFENYTVNGYRLENISDPTDYYELGSYGPNYLTISDQGWGKIQSTISFDELNRPGSETRQYGIKTSIGVVNAEGQPVIDDIPFLSIAKVGFRVAMYRTEDGRLLPTQIPMSIDLTDAQSLNPALERYATPEEAAEYAVTGYLLRNYRGLLDTIAEDEGLEKEDGTLDYIAAAALLFRMETGSITAVEQSIRSVFP